jgi:hypothetical protein
MKTAILALLLLLTPTWACGEPAPQVIVEQVQQVDAGPAARAELPGEDAGIAADAQPSADVAPGTPDGGPDGVSPSPTPEDASAAPPDAPAGPSDAGALAADTGAGDPALCIGGCGADEICGDNGQPGVCGDACQVEPQTSVLWKNAETVCLMAGLPAVWVVGPNPTVDLECTAGAPWTIQQGVPTWRPGASQGCAHTFFDGFSNGQPSTIPNGTYVCCPA